MPTSTPSNLSPTMREVFSLTHRAARQALDFRRQGLTVEAKADDSRITDGTLVTNGDRETQKLLITELAKLYPDAFFLGEEPYTDEEKQRLFGPNAHRIKNPDEWQAMGGKGDFIIIDPIDGTAGYSNTDPRAENPWCISLALQRNGETIAAMVYQAAREECAAVTHAYKAETVSAEPKGRLLWMEKDRGAHLADLATGQQRRLQRLTPEQADSPAQLGDFSGDVDDRRFHPDRLYHSQFVPETWPLRPEQPARNALKAALNAKNIDARRTMSTVDGLMKLAAGEASAFAFGTVFPWDYAAGEGMCSELGIPFRRFACPTAQNGLQTAMLAAHDEALLEHLTATAHNTAALGAELGYPIRHITHKGTCMPVTLTLPTSLDALYASPQADKTLMAAIDASGYNQGAYYMRQEDGSYALHAQVSMDRAHAPGFAQTLAARPDALRHIPVSTTPGGEEKGIIVFAQSPYPEQFTQDFRSKYANEPLANIEAKLALASYIANSFADTLEPPAPTRAVFEARRAKVEWQAEYLETIATHLRHIFDAGFPADDPSDQPDHMTGFRRLTEQLAEKLNAAARRQNKPAPFTPPLQKLLPWLAEIHDIKTHMPMQYMHVWRDKLTPEDAQLPEAERAQVLALKKEFFDRANHNHPGVGAMLLSHFPDLSQASQLHHLSLYRDQTEADREKYESYNRYAFDIEAQHLPALVRLLFLPEVADALINNEQRSPAQMLEQLFAKTEAKNHLGLPMIDPNLLGFALDQGIIDHYIQEKRRPKKSHAELGETLVLDDAYLAMKQDILAKLGYPERREQAEAALVDGLLQDPLIKDHQPQRGKA